MLALPSPLRALLLCFLFTSAHALPPRLLFQREDTCADQKLTSCPADLPDKFCCPAESTCVALAGGTTALCCPDGESCERISPITCDISFQDPEKYPSAGLKTTVLDRNLEKCGEKCCPFGYTCNDDEVCEMQEDQSEPPESASTSTSGSGAPSKTTGPTESTTSVSGEGSTDGDNEDEDGAPTTAIVVGVLLGILGLVSAVVFALIWRSKRRKKAGSTHNSKPNSSRQSPASSRHVRNISAPIMNEDNPPTRFEFNLKSGSVRTADSTPVSHVYRSEPTGPEGDARQNGTAVGPIRGQAKSRFSDVSDQSSTSQCGRESAVSAMSEAHPGARRDTSLTGMMERIGMDAVHKGYPYVREHPSRI